MSAVASVLPQRLIIKARSELLIELSQLISAIFVQLEPVAVTVTLVKVTLLRLVLLWEVTAKPTLTVLAMEIVPEPVFVQLVPSLER